MRLKQVKHISVLTRTSTQPLSLQPYTSSSTSSSTSSTHFSPQYTPNHLHHQNVINPSQRLTTSTQLTQSINHGKKLGMSRLIEHAERNFNTKPPSHTNHTIHTDIEAEMTAETADVQDKNISRLNFINNDDKQHSIQSNSTDTTNTLTINPIYNLQLSTADICDTTNGDDISDDAILATHYLVTVRPRFPIPHHIQELFDFLLEAVRIYSPKTELRVAGGWVRDLLLLDPTYRWSVLQVSDNNVHTKPHTSPYLHSADIGDDIITQDINNVHTNANNNSNTNNNTNNIPIASHEEGDISKILGDIDIAISDLTGSEFQHILEKHGQETNMPLRLITLSSSTSHSRHLETCRGIINGIEVDFVNLRREGYSENTKHRSPTSMQFGTPQQDAIRRDFLCNSLFYNIHTGFIEDYFSGEGLQSIKDGILQTPRSPKTLFIDDPLRILRALRFSIRFQFIIAPSIIHDANLPVVQDALKSKISRERLGKEVRGALLVYHQHLRSDMFDMIRRQYKWDNPRYNIYYLTRDIRQKYTSIYSGMAHIITDMIPTSKTQVNTTPGITSSGIVLASRILQSMNLYNLIFSPRSLLPRVKIGKRENISGLLGQSPPSKSTLDVLAMQIRKLQRRLKSLEEKKISMKNENDENSENGGKNVISSSFLERESLQYQISICYLLSYVETDVVSLSWTQSQELEWIQKSDYISSNVLSLLQTIDNISQQCEQSNSSQGGIEVANGEGKVEADTNNTSTSAMFLENQHDMIIQTQYHTFLTYIISALQPPLNSLLSPYVPESLPQAIPIEQWEDKNQQQDEELEQKDSKNEEKTKPYSSLSSSDSHNNIYNTTNSSINIAPLYSNLFQEQEKYIQTEHYFRKYKGGKQQYKIDTFYDQIDTSTLHHLQFTYKPVHYDIAITRPGLRVGDTTVGTTIDNNVDKNDPDLLKSQSIEGNPIDAIFQTFNCKQVTSLESIGNLDLEDGDYIQESGKEKWRITSKIKATIHDTHPSQIDNVGDETVSIEQNQKQKQQQQEHMITNEIYTISPKNEQDILYHLHTVSTFHRKYYGNFTDNNVATNTLKTMFSTPKEMNIDKKSQEVFNTENILISEEMWQSLFTNIPPTISTTTPDAALNSQSPNPQFSDSISPLSSPSFSSTYFANTNAEVHADRNEVNIIGAVPFQTRKLPHVFTFWRENYRSIPVFPKYIIMDKSKECKNEGGDIDSIVNSTVNSAVNSAVITDTVNSTPSLSTNNKILERIKVLYSYFRTNHHLSYPCINEISEQSIRRCISTDASLGLDTSDNIMTILSTASFFISTLHHYKAAVSGVPNTSETTFMNDINSNIENDIGRDIGSDIGSDHDRTINWDTHRNTLQEAAIIARNVQVIYNNPKYIQYNHVNESETNDTLTSVSTTTISPQRLYDICDYLMSVNQMGPVPWQLSGVIGLYERMNPVTFYSALLYASNECQFNIQGEDRHIFQSLVDDLNSCGIFTKFKLKNSPYENINFNYDKIAKITAIDPKTALLSGKDIQDILEIWIRDSISASNITNVTTIDLCSSDIVLPGNIKAMLSALLGNIVSNVEQLHLIIPSLTQKEQKMIIHYWLQHLESSQNK